MLDAHSLESVTWQKAKMSHPGGMCVEVAPTDGGIALRDSKSPEHGAFFYSVGEFAAFVDGCRRGEFDHLLSGGV